MSAQIKNAVFLTTLVCLLALPAVAADRTNIQPAWNLLTTQQDTEMGRALADEAESRLVFVNQPNANTYIDALGKQLAAHTLGARYPYQFKIVDDTNINMYALPGGFIYVTRGLIDAAQSEPELAGALAHEIAHVVLRHGTAEASQAYADEVSNAQRRTISVNDVMSRLNIHFDPNSIVLNYSREQERQAFVLGTQIMADTGFDPRQMSQFFQTISGDRSNRTADFFKNHTATGNPATIVRTELQNMGGLARTVRGDSPDFHSVKDRYLAGNFRNTPDNRPDSRSDQGPDTPSSRLVLYRGQNIEFRYPENWRVSEDADTTSIMPDGGMVSGSMAYGMTIATYQPQNRYFGRNSFTTGPAASTNLSRATDELIAHLRESNPNMNVISTDQRRRVDGQSAMALELTNDSPIGGQERDWLVTVMRPDGSLRYFVGVVPEREYSRYQRAFEDIIASVRLME